MSDETGEVVGHVEINPATGAIKILKAKAHSPAPAGSGEFTERFWWLIERLKDVPPVKVYPCQTESGHGYFTVETRGERFSASSVEEAIDAARQNPTNQRPGGKVI